MNCDAVAAYKESIFGKIPVEWDTAPIKAVTTVVTDYVANGSFASLAENVKYKSVEDEAVLIRLVDYNNDFAGDFVFIDDHAYNFLSKSKLYGGEIIISNVGVNVGTVFKCPYLKHKMSLAPNSIMVKFQGSNEFYFQWLRSFQGQQMIRSIVTGSAQPKFNKTNFREMMVLSPPLPEQKAIANTLSCLDDKIELNNRMNKTLEEMAQAIFKSWFVDFEPFQDGEFVDSDLGRIPKGWRVGTLLDIADYLNGLAMQNFRPDDREHGLPVLKIKELRQGQPDENSEFCSPNIVEKYIIQDGDVIFSWSGSLLVDIWCGGTCGLNQHLFKVTSDEYDKWFYYYWTKYHLEKFQAIAKDKATTMGHIKREELKKSLVLIPDKENYEMVSAQMKPLVEKIVAGRLQIRKLAEIRDALLPKLMSGEIRVPLEVN